MALFKLTDITFKKDAQGPLTKLENAEGLGVDSNILKYPSDLGSYDKGHYMIIFINEQINSQASSVQFNPSSSNSGPSIQSFRDALTSPTNPGQIVNNLLTQAFSQQTQEAVRPTTGDFARLDRGQTSVANPFSDTGEFGKKFGRDFFNSAAVKNGLTQLDQVINSGSFMRKIKRTKQAIALYMPDTLNFAYNQSYSDLEVFNTLGAVGTTLAAGSSIVDAMKNGGAQNSPVNIASFGLEFLRQSGVSPFISQIAPIGFAQLGVASNPGLEVIYGSPAFRRFRFDFLFYPRDRNEGIAVQRIINSLKYHQAPEYATQTGGKFLIPPSEFDIKFYYNGKENPNIPKISTCVLDSIDLDYAPNRFSTYEIPGQAASLGGTGMPVAIQMALNFRETLIVTKEYLRWTSPDAVPALRANDTTPEFNFGAGSSVQRESVGDPVLSQRDN